VPPPWVAELMERSTQTETLRSLPAENLALLTSAGIIRMAQPEEFGGLGFDLDDVVDVGMELGRGCGSTAWMAVKWPVHNFMIGMYPQSVQELYWANSPDTLSSTCNAGTVTLESVDRGRIVSGALRFSSGIDWANWLQVLCPGGNFLLASKRLRYHRRPARGRTQGFGKQIGLFS
jgi:alkylation response protein AidB-like acyl-CoA dehydrogenase